MDEGGPPAKVNVPGSRKRDVQTLARVGRTIQSIKEPSDLLAFAKTRDSTHEVRKQRVQKGRLLCRKRRVNPQPVPERIRDLE
jgi:hypothetical protein